MSGALAYVGAGLLVAATVPQAWKLVRTRDVDGFAWGFVLLNACGIALLAVRSIELLEPAFIVTNVLTLGFWTGVALIKAARLPPRSVGLMRLWRARS